MALYTDFPVLGYTTKINEYIQADIDIPSEGYSGIGSVFKFTKDTGSEVSIDYKIYDTPLPGQVLSHDSFSTYFLGEQPYNEKLGIRTPLLYSDIVIKGDAKNLTSMVNKATWIAESVEKLIVNNHPSLGGTCNSIMVADILPIPQEEPLKSLTFYGLTIYWVIFPMGINT